MKYCKSLINLFTILFFITWVKAQDNKTEAKPEITLTPGPIIGEYKEKDLDDSYDSGISIQCTGTTCTSTSDIVILNEGNVTISTAGTYVLEGELVGQVYISASKDDNVHLILNNIAITSEYGPAIYEVKCNKLIITSVGENSLTDSTNYPVIEDDDDDDADEDEDENDNISGNTQADDAKKKSPNACLFAKSDLSFNGKGSLIITGNYYEGIRCKKDLKFVSGIINVKAVEKGIKAKNSISIKEATINVDAVNTGIKVTKDTDPEKGFIVIDGGKVTVKAGNDGIHAETHLTINDGFVDVTESLEGLEGQMIDIVGGEIHINASDDGINASKIGSQNDQFGPPGGFGGPGGPGGFGSNQPGQGNNQPGQNAIISTEITSEIVTSIITSEETTESTDSDDDEEITDISDIGIVEDENEDEDVIVTSSTKVPPILTTKNLPIEIASTKEVPALSTKVAPSKTVKTIASVTTTKSAKSLQNRFNKRATDKETQVYIKITGGKVYVKVNGNDVDGIDSNGSLYIGGNAEVYVSNGSGDIYGFMAALDADGSNVIDKGATVIATGSSMGGFGGPGGGSGMGGPPGGFNQTNSSFGGMGGPPGGFGMETGTVKQANIQVSVNAQEAGTEIILKDSDNNVIISHKVETKYSKILISTPQIIAGANYTLIAGTETQTVTASEADE
ncbi:hypothetical protein BCR36DRAFT_345381 [Piromyces finnis]|uniref:Carbohydrate-binding domain-containing protein n=1 Tax=Piromyces finnis TaxID=1754191 RepID=A0A1Y1VIQ8_9FUNG|nr:hypothetical protein BCR36DRAFT_345381 [Piromyces finnis]|eukprot:ORX57287.1 hypothetical protein BCR36DRAFT_345381 [Piromyces finnis]